MSKKWVYFFGGGEAEGQDRAILGGKGAGLAEMTRVGIPVPPGFTISTEVCAHYYAHDRKYPDGLKEEVTAALRRLEKLMSKRLGDPEDPLLVSVRSGAAVSMPGMMETILNLGLNDRSVTGLAKKSQNARFAWDAYRRFIGMFSNVAMDIDPEKFEVALKAKKAARKVTEDTALNAADLESLVKEYLEIYRREAGSPFPQNPEEQLWHAIGAVERSWNCDKAVAYRSFEKIEGLLGTAVSVVTMVFGNKGETSGTGVAFTRDPETGERRPYGELLTNAQGEDVVAGVRTPMPLHEMERKWPRIHADLLSIMEKLENHYKDLQDIEFTVEEGKLYILQTRAGKRSGVAAVRVAVDLVEEGKITKEEALQRVKPSQIEHYLFDIFDEKAKRVAKEEGRLIAKGLNAGPGAASGHIALTAAEAEREGKTKPVVLVRHQTSPEDVRGMHASQAILTSTGGKTSHAALVARGWGKCCVVGCSELDIDYQAGVVRVPDKKLVLKRGDVISVDGFTGEVLTGAIPKHPPEVVSCALGQGPKPEESWKFRTFTRFLGWADEVRRMKVRTNADRPEDAVTARALGAQGIGLCRTEHMFFQGDRITSFRRVILAAPVYTRLAAEATRLRGEVARLADERHHGKEVGTLEERAKHELASVERDLEAPHVLYDGGLKELERMQEEDFRGIFRAMNGLPVTIRLLDPPLHEFVPHEEQLQRDLAKVVGWSYEDVHSRVKALEELNPMLGHRGVRLGVTYPEIYDMQIRAILRAACLCVKEGVKVQPEIMYPIIATRSELDLVLARARVVEEQVFASFQLTRKEVPTHYGTMIEVPCAAVLAGDIAGSAEFFSFGTNDLTQLTLGISRDDSAGFLPSYVAQGIYKDDPFQTIYREGVGQLMSLATERGRATRKDLKVGICGEHGGDPSSVLFCDDIGLDYVSCSPFRVPIARLAAAHGVLDKKKGKKGPSDA